MIDTLTLATSELWCIAPGHAASIHRPTPDWAARPARSDRLALVEIVGTLTKARMVPIRERINQLAATDDVGEILLLVDSPGGTVHGTHDLHLSIARAAARKRVTAVIEDMACSGALYAIACATEIVIGETATTGSIGVYNVVIDETKLLERIGVEIVIVRSGEHKGAGVQGVKLTPDQFTELKRRVDVQARHFVAAVARGRRMSVDRAAELADGRVFIGREAIAAGLADRVATFEEVYGEAVARGDHFAIERLTGNAAAEKFEELLTIETEREYGNRERAKYKVQDKYPQLAAAAAVYVPERRYQYGDYKKSR